MGNNLEDLQWKCQDCDASGPATAYDYMRLLKHQKGHHIRLVNIKNGEIVANTPRQAIHIGIDIPKKVRTIAKQEEKLGGELATILQPGRGAIIFSLGENKISLNPQHLYDAYLYYEDMALRHGLDEEFSLALKISMKYVWERFNRAKAEEEGISITIEGG